MSHLWQECFDPIVATSGRDLIPVMVYGSVVVSAGLLRIFGREVAELPLVATSRENQGKGYFQALFSCIESLLYSLNVENLAIGCHMEKLCLELSKATPCMSENFTRPYLMFAVSLMSKYMAKPTELHLLAAKRILRYLKGTTGLGVFYKKGGCGGLVGYADSDYARDLEGRKSTSGYVFMLGSGVVA
ncbi:hypothetical protein HYC85_004602 [Camellia sinensis]|uniref:Increased DNA methylation 1 C-terminal domain-containing protein n=1 Tax=Camellia sinensis TaxID=4442 RepID=A0A7J7HY75_CAMSI|nr:hypothetical protein HYC85_004602 [Camellia sinensis]